MKPCRARFAAVCAVGLSLILVGTLSPAPLAAAVEEPRSHACRSITEVIEELRQDGANILYSSELVPPGLLVWTEPLASGVEEMLGEILAPVGLTVRAGALGSLLVVRASGSNAEQAEGTVRGRVLSKLDGSPLAGVVVSVSGSAADVSTSGNGRFCLSGLPTGSYIVKAELPDYHPQTLEGVVVELSTSTELVLELTPRNPIARFLGEIVVAPSRYTLYEDEPEIRTSLSREAVNRLPHLADDTFRLLERLPGIASEDASAQVNLRGGEVNEGLVMVDGLEIYEGFHLKDMYSIFSVVDSEAIGGLDVMTGGFPAEYGNRMSGVIDITPATPRQASSTAVGLSFTNLGVLSQGLFDSGRGQWLVSARQTFLDTLMAQIDPDSGFDPSFNDLLARVQLPLGHRTVLSASILGAIDDLAFEDRGDFGDVLQEQVDADSSSTYAWLNLKTAWTSQLYSETVISYGQVERSRKGLIDKDANDATLDDQRAFDFVGFKQDWSLESSRRNLAKWGLDLRLLDATYDYTGRSIGRDQLFTGGGPPEIRERDIHLRPSGDQFSLYVADRFQLAEPLVAELGLRWDQQSYTDDDQLSPRLNLSYRLAELTTLRAAWGYYYQPQYINELQVEDGVTEFFPAQRAEHRLLALDRSWPRLLDLRVEAYRKDLTELRPRYENQLNPIEILPELEPDRILVAPDRAVAEGVEVQLKSDTGQPWSWWLSYAYAKAEDQIDGVWVPRSWDQTHTVIASLNFNRKGQWNFNLSGIHHTGWPTSAIVAEVGHLPDGGRYVIAGLGPRNAERYPDYVRLDLRASRTFQLRKSSIKLFLEVINLFDRENLGRINGLSFRIQPDGSLQVEEDREYVMPILPTLGVRWSF